MPAAKVSIKVSMHLLTYIRYLPVPPFVRHVIHRISTAICGSVASDDIRRQALARRHPKPRTPPKLRTGESPTRVRTSPGTGHQQKKTDAGNPQPTRHHPSAVE